MTVSINVNDLSLVHKGSNGIANATLPDVCKTPSPGGPVPLPYPNIAVSKDLAKGTTTVKVDGGNMAANKGSELFMSTGDEPGAAGGVVSSTFKKEATWTLYSFDVMLEGKNACRLTDKLFMNHMNTVCLAGYIQDFIDKSKGRKHVGDACKALFEYIMEVVDGGGKQWKDRGLDGEHGRFEQNKSGGGLGPQGAPNAPRNHPPSAEHPNGANDWETHDKEIEKQQKKLKELLEEFDANCAPTREQKKQLERAREISERDRPTREEWEGDPWEEPTPEPVPLTTNQKLLIVGGVLLIVGGIAGALFTGGGSLAGSAAGAAIIAGATAATAGATAGVIVGPAPAPSGGGDA